MQNSFASGNITQKTIEKSAFFEFFYCIESENMINFEYYLNEYEGKKISSEEIFNSLERVAEKHVLRATDNRGNIKEIGEAICAVADILFDK